MSRFSSHGLALAASLLSAACVTFDIGESHFFLPGPASAQAPRTIAGATVEDVKLTAADGTALGGVYLRQPEAGAEVL